MLTAASQVLRVAAFSRVWAFADSVPSSASLRFGGTAEAAVATSFVFPSCMMSSIATLAEKRRAR